MVIAVVGLLPAEAPGQEKTAAASSRAIGNHSSIVRSRSGNLAVEADGKAAVVLAAVAGNAVAAVVSTASTASSSDTASAQPAVCSCRVVVSVVEADSRDARRCPEQHVDVHIDAAVDGAESVAHSHWLQEENLRS